MNRKDIAPIGIILACIGYAGLEWGNYSEPSITPLIFFLIGGIFILFISISRFILPNLQSNANYPEKTQR